MSDEPETQRFIRTERLTGKGVVSALTLRPQGEIPLRVARLSWSKQLAARLREAARAAADSRAPEGKALPFASLRAALQVQIPEALLLAADLGAPWKWDEPLPFLDVPVTDNRDRDPALLASCTLRTWWTMVLRPWAERVGLDEDLVDAIDECSCPDDAFTIEKTEADLAKDLSENASFGVLKHRILQVIAQRLEGQELFDGLGPVYRIIRSRANSNEISFQTWPAEARGGLYSMVARLTVETAPYLDRPLITVKAGRRLWLADVPEGRQLRGRRRMTGYLMGKNAAHVAVECELAVRGGEVQSPFSPIYMIQALNISYDLAVEFKDAVKRGASADTFAGIPYSPQYDGSHPVGSGASTRDHLDLLSRTRDLLADDGFDLLPYSQAKPNKEAPRRSPEQHRAVAIGGMLADVAFSIGHNDLSSEALQEACSSLMEGLEVKGVSRRDALEARKKLEEVRQANLDRLRRTYGDEQPTVAVIARTEQERNVMRSCIKGLFGEGVKVVSHPLPAETHGARPTLPRPDAKKAKDRFEARVEAWKPLADHLAANHEGCHALVQARETFEAGKDDNVNKLAGRYALATHANANVQYLLPPNTRRGWHGLQHYLHRAQSALYDLLFGHAGLVSEIKSLIEGAFPDPSLRPKAIIGISVITQGRTRKGAPGGEICLATRVDADTGRTQARVGWFKGRMLWTAEWEPFFKVMKQVASPEVSGTLGGSLDVKKASFQAFVKEIVSGAVEEADFPLVLIDSTSAVNLWSWLKDDGIGKKVVLDREGLDMAVLWAGARLVRVRKGHAGHILVPKLSRFAPIDPETGEVNGEPVEVRGDTITAATVALSREGESGAAHYWITPGYSMQITRGLSVYRTEPGFVNDKQSAQKPDGSGKKRQPRFFMRPFDISDKSYRLPSVVDVTVAMHQPGDDPDKIAHLVASLREGYGHSPLPTALPAPLSFESKARDYMTRFALDEADAEDEAEEDDAEEDEAAAPGTAQEDLPGLKNTEEAADGETEPEPEAEADPSEPVEPVQEALPQARDDEPPGQGTKEDHVEQREQKMPAAPAGDDDARSLSERRRTYDLNEYFAQTLSPRDSTSDQWLTSVSGRAMTRVLGLEGLPRPGAGRAARRGARKLKRKTLVLKAPPGGVDSVATQEQTATNRSGDRSSGLRDIWPQTSKEPVLPVPDFVTTEWFRDKVSIPERLRREIHQWREEIRVLSGYPWPEQRPDEEQMLDILVDGVRYPGFIRALTRVAARHIKKARREHFNIFTPYQKRVGAAMAYLARQQKTKAPNPADVAEVTRFCLSGDRPDLVIERAYLCCLGVGYEEVYTELSKDYPEVYAPIVDFLEAAALHLKAGEFDWLTDVIEQRDAPSAPPPPAATANEGAEAQGGEEETKDVVASGVVDEGESKEVTPSEGPGAADTGVKDAGPQGTDVGEGEATGGPAQGQGNMKDMEAFREDWRRAMREIMALAEQSAEAPPSEEALASLREAFFRADAAQEGWQEAQPKHVEAAPLASAIADVEAEATALVSEKERGEPLEIDFTVRLVQDEAAEAIQQKISEAYKKVAQATKAKAQLKEAIAVFSETMANSDYEKVGVLKDEVSALVAGILAQLKEAATDLIEGAVPEAPMPPDPTSGPHGPGGTPRTDTRGSGVPPVEGSSGGSGTTAEASLATIDQEMEQVSDDSALELLAEESEEADREESEGLLRAEVELAPAALDAAPDAEPEDEPQEPEESPLVGRISEKLSELAAAREFGLAHHLLHAAQQSFPASHFDWSEPELRLVAIAPHIKHAAMMGSETLSRLLEDTLQSREASSEDPALSEERVKAQNLLLYGATAAITLFHPGTVAKDVLQSVPGVDPSLNVLLHNLRDALVSGSRLSITPMMFLAASRTDEEFQHGEECRQAALACIQSIEAMTLKASLGTRIQGALCRGDGAVGKLHAALKADGKKALSAARDFMDAYGRRSSVRDLLDETEAGLATRKQGLHGGVRDRLVGAILHLAEACKEFVEAQEARPQIQNANRLRGILQTKEDILAPLGQLIEKLADFERREDPVLTGAARYASKTLGLLREIVEGKAKAPEADDHLIALYGPLLWLPGLQFGRSWLPSPYSPETMISAILSAPVPLLDEEGDRAQALVDAAGKRLQEDSFVAARLLAESAEFYGAGAEAGDAVRTRIEAEIPVRREAMASYIEEVTRQVDRIQRMGLLKGVDAAQSLLFRLERIDVAKLPVDPREEPRNEEESDDEVLDFAAAETVVRDVADDVETHLEERRQVIRARLDDLISSEGREDDQTSLVRSLIEKDDLLTAEEYLEFLEHGQELPKSSSAHRRFQEYFPDVPKELAKRGKHHAAALTEAMRQGEDFGPLLFSRLPEDRRDEVVSIYEGWRNLRERVRGGHQQTHVAPLLSRFFDEMRLQNTITRIDPSLTIERQKTYVVEMELDIPSDAAGFLLPDFGSVTNGHYRVCLLDRMPNDAELEKLRTSSGEMGVVVLVMDAIDAERRKQLAVYCIRQNHRVLVIDESILLYALSEPELRPLTLFECAQPFSLAAPYRDYGNAPVPPEMFFGRDLEKRKIVETSGSCIVYGGRRLGKTALLRHVAAEEHQPDNGILVAYVNVQEFGVSIQTGDIWHFASRELTEIFPTAVSDPTLFADGIRAWLRADPRRRVLVLFDECDRFIETDASQNYRQFLHLRTLMDATNRRFKFVLAGLHNVTRLVHTENPPLKHIASDPQRIGPLMDDELADAESLVTRPLAAMGYEFDNREDVWRILSHCNYYPVLIQTFCKGLLESLHQEVIKQQKPIFNITSDRVRKALENEAIAKEIGRTFEYTIAIDERYKLIANIMAQRALADAESGRSGEGMTAVEVLDAARSYWPSAFSHPNRLSTVEDLLDEMEGLGVLRRVTGDAWALRSHTVLRLLGNEAKVETVLEGFIGYPPPAAFSPRSMRRPLELPDTFKLTKGHRCPLTLGQEHDLLTEVSEGNQQGAQIWAIFGNQLSDVGLVAIAMARTDHRGADGSALHVEAKVFKAKEDLLKVVSSQRSGRSLIMVDWKSPWNASWIEMLLKQRAVREGRVRVALVGSTEHALRWVRDARFQPPPAGVRSMALQTWSDAMVDEILKGENIPPEEFRETTQRLTGGFNRPTSEVFLGSINSKQLQTRLERTHKRLCSNKTLLEDLGIAHDIAGIFKAIPQNFTDIGYTSAYEIREGVLPSVANPLGLSARQVIEYGVLLGLFDPVAPSEANDDTSSYALNPLLMTALAPELVEEAAE